STRRQPSAMYPSPRARADYRRRGGSSARGAGDGVRSHTAFRKMRPIQNADLRNLRRWVVASRGEAWEGSTHPDVSSEVSRLGSLGGTSARAGADARSENQADGETASPESRRRAASALIATHDRVFRRTARRYSICADDAEDAYQRA